MKRGTRWVSIFAIALGVLFLGACGITGESPKDTPTPEPTATASLPEGAFFPASAYFSKDARVTCAVLAESLVRDDALGVIAHTVLYYSISTGDLMHVIQDQRFGMAFRINNFVLTARHVVGPVDFIPRERMVNEGLRREDSYEFHPLQQFFSYGQPVIGFPRFTDELYNGAQGVPIREVYGPNRMDEFDFVVFEGEGFAKTPSPTTSPAAPVTLVDFEPTCLFRLYIDPDFTTARVHVLLGKSFTKERSDRELGGDFVPQSYRTGGVFAFYGGFGYGPGASGSPVFLRGEDGEFHIIGISVIIRSVVIAFAHDINIVQSVVERSTGVNIFQK